MAHECHCETIDCQTPAGNEQAPSPDRREWVKGMAAVAAGLMAAGCTDQASVDAFLQKHFRELSKSELQEVLERLEKQYSEQYGKDVEVKATPAKEGVNFGYALDISRCIGCRRCVYACVGENNQSRDPQVHWITVLEMDKEHGVSLEHADAYYDGEQVPREGKFYFPVACQQCSNPPCCKVCPVNATYPDQDGIVVIDYDWCIGCRCCMSACPYGARHFNFAEPEIPAEQMNPKTHYLGNRPRMRGPEEPQRP